MGGFYLQNSLFSKLNHIVLNRLHVNIGTLFSPESDAHLQATATKEQKNQKSDKMSKQRIGIRALVKHNNIRGKPLVN